MEHPRGYVLDAYVEGELAPEVWGLVEEHLASCADCRDRAELLRQPATLLRHLSPEEPPADLRRRIVERVTGGRRLTRREATLRLGATILGIALVAVSWSEIGTALAQASSVAHLGTAWSAAASQWMEIPLDTLSAAAGGTLAWESALAESVGVGLVLGLALLTVSSFAWLSRVVQTSPRWATYRDREAG